jgi:hypothetical protein
VWESGTPFADLVREAAEGTTYRKLAEQAVDQRSGYRAAHTTLWKIAKGEQVKIHPALVRAVATATGRPEREVQIAAAQQYVGLVADEVGMFSPGAAVVVAHVPGMTAGDMPKVQDLLNRWAAHGGSGVSREDDAPS